MDTYEGHCDEHGTYHLQPKLKGCPHCRIAVLESEVRELRGAKAFLAAKVDSLKGGPQG